MTRRGKLRRSVLAWVSLLATAGIAVGATQQAASAAQSAKLGLYATANECNHYGWVWTSDGDSPYGDWGWYCEPESGRYRLWVVR